MAKEAKTEPSVEDEYEVQVLEKSESITPEQVLNNLNVDVLPKLNDRESTEPMEVTGRIKLFVHNPFVEDGNTDYNVYVYLTNEGSYYTSSESFDSSIKQMESVQKALGVAGDLKIQIVKKPSKNNAGNMLLAKACF